MSGETEKNPGCWQVGHQATEILHAKHSLHQRGTRLTKICSTNEQWISVHVLVAYHEPICELKVSVTGDYNRLSIDVSDNTGIVTLFSDVWQINRVPCAISVPIVTLTCPYLHSNSLWIYTCAVYCQHGLHISISANPSWHTADKTHISQPIMT